MKGFWDTNRWCAKTFRTLYPLVIKDFQEPLDPFLLQGFWDTIRWCTKIFRTLYPLVLKDFQETLDPFLLQGFWDTIRWCARMFNWLPVPDKIFSRHYTLSIPGKVFLRDSIRSCVDAFVSFVDFILINNNGHCTYHSFRCFILFLFLHCCLN